MSISLQGGLRYHQTVTRAEQSSNHCALLWLPQSRRLLLDIGYNISALGAAFQGKRTADFFHLTAVPFNPHAIGTVASGNIQITLSAHHHLFVGAARAVSVRYGGLSGSISVSHAHPLFSGGRPVTVQASWSCTRMLKIGLPHYG